MLLDLPDDLLSNSILKYLTVADLCRLAGVCHKFHRDDPQRNVIEREIKLRDDALILSRQYSPSSPFLSIYNSRQRTCGATSLIIYMIHFASCIWALETSPIWRKAISTLIYLHVTLVSLTHERPGNLPELRLHYSSRKLERLYDQLYFPNQDSPSVDIF